MIQTVLISVIIRTYNEAKYLGELLKAISNQKKTDFEVEVIIVDSGSTDETINIAKKYNCCITYIEKRSFTFGRSLNIGCRFADGDIFVFISGHCIPVRNDWLENLISPLIVTQASYSYGRQIGRDTTKFSERCLFEKYFPKYSKIPQKGFFCNNANAALKRSSWESFMFNEELTGLEDMYLAKTLTETEEVIAYVASASVYHIHDESWAGVKIRYEREAIALQKIMPNIYFGLGDFIKYLISSIWQDSKKAAKGNVFLGNFTSILLFRLMQHWGVYRGNYKHRKLSNTMKHQYFYPKDVEKPHYEKENCRSTTNESK